MKYLIFNCTGIQRVFIFSQDVTHKDFAEKMGSEWKAIRGGFIHQRDDGSLQTFGESFSLELQSDPDKDEELIRQQLGGWFQRPLKATG